MPTYPVELILLNKSPYQGTFRLQYKWDITNPIHYTASPSCIKGLLESLETVRDEKLTFEIEGTFHEDNYLHITFIGDNNPKSMVKAFPDDLMGYDYHQKRLIQVTAAHSWRVDPSNCARAAPKPQEIKDARIVCPICVLNHAAKCAGAASKPQEIKDAKIECLICMSSNAVYIMDQCHHLAYCEGCNKKAPLKCPICRKDSQRTVRIYY